MCASPGRAHARAPAVARHDPSRHPARQRLPGRTGSAGRVRPVLGRAAGDGAAGAVRAALFSDVPACRPRRRQHRRRCLCAWGAAALPGARPRTAGGARRCGDPAPQAGTWDLRRAGGRSAAAADHRRSGARHAGRGPGTSADRRPCCSTRRARVDVGWRHGRRGERSGPSSSRACEVWDARSLACALARRARPRAERGARQRRRAMAAPRVGRRAARHAGGRAGAPSQPGQDAGRRRWRGRAGDARDRGARSAGAAMLARGGAVAGRHRHRAGCGPGQRS